MSQFIHESQATAFFRFSLASLGLLYCFTASRHSGLFCVLPEASKGLFHDARQSYQKAIFVDPTQAAAWVNLGFTCLAQVCCSDSVYACLRELLSMLHCGSQRKQQSSRTL